MLASCAMHSVCSTHAWQLLVAILGVQRHLLGLDAGGILPQGMQLVEDLLSLGAAAAGQAHQS